MEQEREVSSQSRKITDMVMKISIIAIFTALEAIVTLYLQIPLPASQGYFNVGEAIIYFTAIVFGPFIGAFVGGVGAAIADIIAFPLFAPGTLIIKAAEGFVIGILFKGFKKFSIIDKNWKYINVVMGIILGVIFSILGNGSMWMSLLGLSLTLLIIILSLTIQKEIGKKLIALIIGGLVMVGGYFLYESLILNLISPEFYENALSAAWAEVPFNVLQVVSGIFIAIPLIAAIEPVKKKMMPDF